MAVKIHSIKIAPQYLDAVVAGQKRAEVRRHDRDYRVGDLLTLCEWKHGKYTGREWAAVITHILPVGDVIAAAEGWSILSVRALSPSEALFYIFDNGVDHDR
ncbi:DUF3850 domain-containing protein [Klebsiella pneumoniae]|uniref:DUF3850 domain-containing protein n=1 Tax=Klebsiella TaxID=570 RepID=UPI0007D6D2F3|nr:MULTISPECIES: DUF3850 domain-containing protein [Klebsiella]EHC5032644.1 DUF3850 domain-containing protein [Escherichia coli]AVE37659.1 DUF3850 domain-containing protein [Klebsiella aerogenes]EKU0351620.1 DUF3850 domain-containing protein [Klebsiella aerogenes]UNX69446.1 DUF3850 domain-containing protein [Klebsiella aerogenes]HBR0847328.1 DUF3850 domain-containing protein [Klebsiella pneumoniae]